MTTIRGDGSTISAGVSQVGSSGTVHAGDSGISSGFGPSDSGTIVHEGGPNIGSGYSPSRISFEISLNIGDPLVINSVTYQYQGIISDSTGEAQIYLLSHNGKNCVLKLYYQKFKPKEDVVRQLKQINHDDIVNVIDYGYYHGRFFEIMDFAEGGTLDKYLPIKDVPQVKKLVAEIINAFKFCHEKGIVHKDIKPQNLYFKNSDGTDLIIGDFGTSTMLESGMSRRLTSQSLTVGYAAPEMYGIPNEKNVIEIIVGREVDYYALGITIIHIWDGKSPFDGLLVPAIANATTSGLVKIPEDMPSELQNLVKGLITVDYTKRWGYQEILKWLRGENVPIYFKIEERSYPTYKFSPGKEANDTAALADLLKTDLDKGIYHLYNGRIVEWVKKFDQGLAVELDIIVEEEYPSDQDAGLQKAIYILNPDEPFFHKNQHSGEDKKNIIACRTAEELANALEEGFEKYKNKLSNNNHSFYLYLEAHNSKKEANVFKKYFNTFSPKKALNTIILELRGGDGYRIGDELFCNLEELAGYKNTDFLVKQFLDEESLLSLWIERYHLNGIQPKEDKFPQNSSYRNERIEILRQKYPEHAIVKHFDSLRKLYDQRLKIAKKELEDQRNQEKIIKKQQIDTKEKDEVIRIRSEFNKNNFKNLFGNYSLIITSFLLIIIYLLTYTNNSSFEYIFINKVFYCVSFISLSIATVFSYWTGESNSLSKYFEVASEFIAGAICLIILTFLLFLDSLLFIGIFQIFNISTGMQVAIAACIILVLLVSGNVIFAIIGLFMYFLSLFIHNFNTYIDQYKIEIILTGIIIFSIFSNISFFISRKKETTASTTKSINWNDITRSEFEIIDNNFQSDLKITTKKIWSQVFSIE